ncbi:hypothetical protein [Chimaeribacter californicus]|nr:hypothetical protein [Chimaeribacter californicus]
MSKPEITVHGGAQAASGLAVAVSAFFANRLTTPRRPVGRAH